MQRPASHHPIFQEHPPWRGELDDRYQIYWTGARFRKWLFEGRVPPGPAFDRSPDAGARVGCTGLPAFDEDYFEWISVLLAAKAAREQFVMIELGAGYGRWLVGGAAAVRHLNPRPMRLVGVEAEPSNFRWMKEVFRDNGLDPREHWLIEAAVNDKDGEVLFHVGDAQRWYGQRIAAGGSPEAPESWGRRLMRYAARVFGRKPQADPQQVGLRRVKAISLNRILAKLGTVDLIDADIQGEEALVFEASADRVDAQVRRVHIGTHGPEVEAQLRALFRRLGWEPVFDYFFGSRAETPYGLIDFQDGVQAWVNPKLEAAARRKTA